jgi:hypothetical protein
VPFTTPTILKGFIFIAEKGSAAVVAMEMWEPVLCAGFQAPGDYGWEFSVGYRKEFPGACP